MAAHDYTVDRKVDRGSCVQIECRSTLQDVLRASTKTGF